MPYKRMILYCRTCGVVVPFEVPWRHYCSKKCKRAARTTAHMKWLHAAKEQGRYAAVPTYRKCEGCGNQALAPAKFCTSECYRATRYPPKTNITRVSCRDCGVGSWRKGTGTQPLRCTACTKERKRAQLKARPAIEKPSRRAKDRARKYGATYHYIKPSIILNRDSWQCQACECDTPKEHRGTTLPTAPEVDHIIPFAQGGHHILENLQTLCRSCNLAKGG